MGARTVVVLVREEEWMTGALITNPLFGIAYLVFAISCDAAPTTVRVSTSTSTIGPKHVQKHGHAVPTLTVHGFLTIRHGK